MFAELRRYRDQHGDCNVLSDSEETPELAAWVSNQREFQKAGRLRADRKDRLDELGFVWDAREAAWESMFAELKRYKEKYGHCNETLYKERLQPKLAAWVNKQRKLQKEGRLRADRQTRLDELGFVWNTLDAAWFIELKRYKEEYGDCNVRQKWRHNLKLAAWVSFQRVQERAGKLSAERKARLDELGFDWDPLANKRRAAAE
jgi:hypothetical protein